MSLRRKLDRLRDAGPGSRKPPGKPSRQAHEGRGEPGPWIDSGESGREPGANERAERIDRLRSLMRETFARQQKRQAHDTPSPPRASAALPGTLHDTAHGPLHVVERYLEPHHCHGHTPVQGALRVQAPSVAKLALDSTLESLDPRRLLFMDTETTGLSGGAGTIPFLVGMGWFEDESMRLEQMLLRRPGQEAPMLHRLAERMAEASCMVTYNGKSFDWPLLRNRFVLNRVPMPEPPPHLDLLHCARRVYKRRMDSVRLVDMEVEVLGKRREDDVDGSEIPGIYLRYLRAGQCEGLGSVIEHNGDDLIALAALLHRLCERFEEVQGRDDPRDHLSYAELAERAGDGARARKFAEAAAQGGGDAACTARAWMLSARLARRRGDTDTQQHALTQALEATEDELDRAEAHLGLAKLYEHQRKDPARALEHARHTELAEGPEAHRRRTQRLQRRQDATRASADR